jgi:hypothetical protein
MSFWSNERHSAAILAGRGFVDADAAEGSVAVIVDRTFATAVQSA